MKKEQEASQQAPDFEPGLIVGLIFITIVTGLLIAGIIGGELAR